MQHDPAISALDGRLVETPESVVAVHERGRPARIASRALLGSALLLFLAAGGLYWFRLSYGDRIYPAVTVGGVAVGGRSYADARREIESTSTAIEAQTVTFVYAGKTWSATLHELGVTIDRAASIDQAFAVGREDDARERVASAFKLVRHDRAIPLQVTLDQTVLYRWLDGVDADLGIPPRDASLAVEDGKVTLIPEVEGTVVDRAKTTDLLLQSLATLDAPTGQLPVIAKTATVHVADLEPIKAQLETALGKPVKLLYGKKSWTLDPADLGDFVVIAPSEDAATPVEVSLDRKALAKWLAQEVGVDINRDPVNAEVGWSLEKGKVVAIEPSKDGLKLKPTSLAEGVTASFFGSHEPVDVPVVVTKPDIDDARLDELGITTRLAIGTSNFDGSDEGRATNIIVGAQKLNGHLIPPGELFSFNRSVGIISEENGFVESNVVDGERIGRDVGGGICQVSTTVFRAALYAGMPIEEWHPHRYRMGFYELDDWPMGLDASILQPEGDPFSGGDFTFWNATGSWMLMEAYTDGTLVVIIIYGADLGYNVDIEGPKVSEPIPPTDDIEIVDEKLDPGTIEQSEYKQQGWDVEFVRTVLDRDGNEVLVDAWQTHFYPRGDVYKVSPDMKGQSPASLT